MEDIELIVLGIIEMPLTKEGYKEINNILSRVNTKAIDLRPYFFKELDEKGIVYIDKDVTTKTGKTERITGYFKDGKKIIFHEEYY